MPYTNFYELCPQISEKETRVITLLDVNNEFKLPLDEYTFVEMFCDECDCRRAMIVVLKGADLVAVIAWGWESYSFYKKWYGFDDKAMINEMMGVELNMMSPQSKIAPQVLEMFKKVLFTDKIYTERVKRHYQQFRAVLLSKNSKK